MPEMHDGTIEADGLLRLLPHRFAFLLVDRVVELERGVRISASKHITGDEPFVWRSRHAPSTESAIGQRRA